jgi:pimeloyl-ACP methyl ester carboxylesterase
VSADDVIAEHEASGRHFTAGGVRSFVLDRGSGEAVVLMHGVPASCFLYRKVIAELAARGKRGIAFDLPGMGLADRPDPYDYTWTGLGRFSLAAIDALQIERFHLVVHDIGGPIGFEVARAIPDRIASLTLLNTVVDPHQFSRPWPMAPFAVPVLGWIWLNAMTPWLFERLWYLKGIADRSSMTKEEIEAYFRLLKRNDRGKAFLAVMKGFELTPEKTALYHAALHAVPYPVRILWGADDTALTLKNHGERARRACGVKLETVPGKHFFPEEQAAAIAARL